MFVHLKTVLNMLVDPQTNKFVQLLPKLNRVPTSYGLSTSERIFYSCTDESPYE